MGRGALGVVIAVAGAALGSLGDTLCRFSYAQDQQKNPGSTGVSKLWMAGITMCTVVENFLTILSLNFASAAIVTPIAGLHIALNTALSKLCLKENLIALHYVGCLLILGGLTVTLSVGTSNSPVYNIEQLLRMYTQASFLVFAMLCLCSVGLFAYVSFGRSEERETTEIVPGRPHHGRVGSTDSSSPSDSTAATDTPMRVGGGKASGGREPSRLHAVLPRRIVTMRAVKFPWGFRRFSIAAISGMAGGNANVMLEGILRSLSSASNGLSATLQWQFALLFFFLTFLLMIQLYCLNKGIDTFEGLKTVPQTNAVLIAIACLASLNLFSSVLSVSSLRLLAFVAGTGSVVWGILLLSQADTMREIRELQALEVTLGNSEFAGSISPPSSISSDADAEADRYLEALEIESSVQVQHQRSRNLRSQQNGATAAYDDVLDDHVRKGPRAQRYGKHRYDALPRRVLEHELESGEPFGSERYDDIDLGNRPQKEKRQGKGGRMGYESVVTEVEEQQGGFGGRDQHVFGSGDTPTWGKLEKKQHEARAGEIDAHHLSGEDHANYVLQRTRSSERNVRNLVDRNVRRNRPEEERRASADMQQVRHQLRSSGAAAQEQHLPEARNPLLTVVSHDNSALQDRVVVERDGTVTVIVGGAGRIDTESSSVFSHISLTSPLSDGLVSRGESPGESRSQEVGANWPSESSIPPSLAPETRVQDPDDFSLFTKSPSDDGKVDLLASSMTR